MRMKLGKAEMKQSITAQAMAQAETLVRTMIANEINTAQLASFAEEGVQAVEWVSVLDDATTPDCEELDGKQWLLPPTQPITKATYQSAGTTFHSPAPSLTGTAVVRRSLWRRKAR